MTHVIEFISRLKKHSHHPSGYRKRVWQNSTTIRNKTVHKRGPEVSCLTSYSTPAKPTATVLTGQRRDVLSLKPGLRRGSLISLLLFIILLEDRDMQVERWNKTLPAHTALLCTQEILNNLYNVARIEKFSKIAGYRVIISKPIVFLCEPLEIEIKPLIIAPQNIKYLTLNLF